MISSTSNPGAATPESLHRLYKNQAAVTANPYTLRQFSGAAKAAGKHVGKAVGFQSILDERRFTPAPVARVAVRRRDDSPPRASFRCVSGNASGRTGDVHALLLKR